MNLFDTISDEIKSAMKAKDRNKLAVLRNVKKYFLEALAAPGADDTLADEEALKIIQKLVKQSKDSAAIYQEQGREDLAKEELDQVEVLETFLPKQLSDEELQVRIEELVKRLGASSPKDMGKVMGAATKELAGIAEGRKIASTVKDILNR